MKIEKFQEKVMSSGLMNGFEDMEIYYERAEGLTCEIYQGEVDRYETSRTGGLSFRGIYEGKTGYAFTEKIEADSIDYLIEKAKANAELDEEEEPEEIFAGSEEYEEVAHYSEALSEKSTADKIAFLKEVEEKILGYNSKIQSLHTCRMIEQSNERLLANSKGLVLHDRKNFFAIMLSVIVKEEDETKSGFTMKMTKDVDALDADEVAKEAAEEALSYLGEQSIANKKYPIIFRQDAAVQMLGTFLSSFSAEVAQKGQSRLKDQVGEEIASKQLTIIDDPFYEGGPANRNFDGEGVASKKCTVIENGKLKTLLHNRKTAKKAGVETTGHAYKPSYKGTVVIAPSNFIVAGGEKTKDDLVAEQKEAVLITKLSGLHSGANAISGDFSVAANGFYVKDGKIVAPVKQMTIAGNFFELLKDIEEVGSDLYVSPGGTGSPSLLVKELSVTVD
ncbi:TldD/PmbA family protein [Lederbergia sp. NSJ-179]|uniref:TldD/PmbA family protein n=1 Tax=Lederbergia sp. NSJ-179 TaxID=2931402 RepID=UPI001FD3C1EA|nr:TldD/PmbA family protein [Lederbergia sp. NSJ-179]MCJ7841071.1 TldD/PmbA family protein [Lederbergia sp. NSJ-179]